MKNVVIALTACAFAAAGCKKVHQAVTGSTDDQKMQAAIDRHNAAHPAASAAHDEDDTPNDDVGALPAAVSLDAKFVCDLTHANDDKAPDHGYLIPRSIPWAEVLVDGQDTGKTTPMDISEKLTFPPGNHTVTFVLDGKHFDCPQPITIKAGMDSKVFAKLQPIDPHTDVIGIVQDTFFRSSIYGCWKKQPNAPTGPLQIDFTVGTNGKASGVKVTFPDATVAKCVSDRAATWAFFKLAAPDTFSVSFPMPPLHRVL